MNNAEKFKEVFGLDLADPSRPGEVLPCIFDYRYCIPGWKCDGCQLQNFWTKEYDSESSELNQGLDHVDQDTRKLEQLIEELAKEYHTCGRCKYEQLPEDVYPCDRCMYGPDDRYDFWEAKDDE